MLVFVYILFLKFELVMSYDKYHRLTSKAAWQKPL